MAKESKVFEMMDADRDAKGVGTAIKDAVQAVFPGLSWSKFKEEVVGELKRLGVQGQMELASALFTGNAFVSYGPGQYTPDDKDAPLHGPTADGKAEQERSRGIEM